VRPIVKSEFRKLRATPTMWWLLLAVVGIGVAATIGVIAFTSGDNDMLTSNKALREAMHAAGAGSVLVSVAGIIGMAGEFRFGQADQTFLSTPRRADVVWAKTLVFGLLGLLFGLVATAASIATLGVYLASEGERLPLGREAVWLTAAGDVGSAVLFAILGVAIGAISRNQVAAIVGTLAWLMLVEGILFPITDLARWLPGSAARALRRDTAADLLSMRSGATVLALWALAALALGLARTVRDDITERATR
jgi:ABC-2 type transport system permease protein